MSAPRGPGTQRWDRTSWKVGRPSFPLRIGYSRPGRRDRVGKSKQTEVKIWVGLVRVSLRRSETQTHSHSPPPCPGARARLVRGSSRKKVLKSGASHKPKSKHLTLLPRGRGKDTSSALPGLPHRAAPRPGRQCPSAPLCVWPAGPVSPPGRPWEACSRPCTLRGEVTLQG